ncbi:MAG: TMEM165/GDT1 family protein [Candidatus Firestonebacteria bacterium]
MDLKIFFTIFTTVLFAELGDKTQLATLLFATDKGNPRLMVFLASATALVVASALAVLLGNIFGRYVNPKYLAWIAGVGFMIVGIWTIVKA